jgi:hypothetical protein
VEEYLLNAEKPPLFIPPIPKKTRPGWWKEKFRVAMVRVRKALYLKPLPPPPLPPSKTRQELEAEAKAALASAEEDDAEAERHSAMALADNRVADAMPGKSAAKFVKRQRRRARNHKNTTEAGASAVADTGAGVGDDDETFELDVASTPSPEKPSPGKSVRFERANASPNSASPSSVNLFLSPTYSPSADMPPGAKVRSPFPYTVRQRMAQDAETTLLIIEMKEESERLEARRQKALSAGR